MLADAEQAIPFALMALAYASPVALLFATWLIGRWMQKKHVASLTRREADVGKRIIVTSCKELPAKAQGTHGQMVSGSVVVSTDYFRRFLASWRTLVGGRVNSIEPVLMRARREAVLRMLEKADGLGANFVVNLRLETSAIRGNSSGKQGRQFAMCEVFAYGTAVKTSHETNPYGVTYNAANDRT